MRGFIHKFDHAINRWITETFGTFFRLFFRRITLLGDPITIFVIAIALACAGIVASNVQLILTAFCIPLTVGVGAALKVLFVRARPSNEYTATLRTLSFPSGHSSGSMIAYGIFAYIALVLLSSPWNWGVFGILLLIPLAVGISRVYLGAHYPSDVVAGWALGIVMLAVVITVIKPFV